MGLDSRDVFPPANSALKVTSAAAGSLGGGAKSSPCQIKAVGGAYMNLLPNTVINIVY